MDFIDYNEAKLSFMGTRKHFFKDQQYYITVFDDQIILGNTSDTQSPKYKIPIDLNLKISWDLKKYKNKTILTCFVFPFQNKIKAVHANHEDLTKLKQFLGVKVTYEGIGDMYLPILQIGKGSSAKVYSAENILNQKVYAIKAIEKAFLNQTEKGQGLAAYKMEIQILKILSNYTNHFLTLKEIYEGDQTYYLVTDYLEGQSLSEEIDKAKTLPEKRLPIQCIKMIMAKLLSSLALLHQHKIIHRDLKPDNLMFSKKNDYSSLVMVDFGLATSELLDKFLFPKCGTPGFVAPEILTLLPNNKYTTKVDIFSCGCILYKLLTGRSVFSGKTFDEVLKANKKCSIDLDLPLDKQYITEDSLNLLSQLLNKNPKLRISAKQALQHQFFDQVSEFSTQLYASIFSNMRVQNNGNLNFQCEEQISQYDINDEHINQEIKEDETKIIQQIPLSKRCSLMSEFQSLLKSQLQFYQKEPLSCIRCYREINTPKEDQNENFD